MKKKRITVNSLTKSIDMKKMTLFTFIVTILFSVSGLAATEPVAPVEDQGSQQRSCEQHQQEIRSHCSQNPSFLEAQQNEGTVGNVVNNGQQAGQTAQTLQLQQGTLNSSQTALNAAREQCRQAAESCWGQCESERVKHQNEGTRLSSNPTTASQAPPEFQQASRAQNSRDLCKREADKSMEEMKKASMDIAQLLQAIASLLQALGIGQDDGGEVAITDPEDPEDPCEGANAALLIECAGESDPIGSRASVSGSTGVGDLSGGNGQGLMGQTPDGSPGGEDIGSGGSNFPSNGQFGAAGSLGAFGDSPGSSVGAASEGSSKLDTDIHKGYMSGGDGGFGSFSSGGGGGARSSGSSVNPFSRTATGDGRQKLQSALDKAVSAGRGPASADGTNGPFQNIWGVVTQTYKKTSPSMFHKE